MKNSIFILKGVLLLLFLFSPCVKADLNLFFKKDYTNYLNSLNSKNITEIEALYKEVSLYRLGLYEEAVTFSSNYLHKNYNSLVKDYFLFYESLSYLQQGNKKQCLKLLISLKSSTNQDIQNQALFLADKIANKSLNTKELLNLSKLSKDNDIFKELTPNSNEFNILVVLPLTGINSVPGKELLRGIEFAFEKSKKETAIKINLNVLNSESSNSVMQKKILSYLKNRHVDLVIGELESGMSAALAGICTIKNIPLLIPVAIENNLSEIGKNIYQLNVSSYELGKKMADYAIAKKNQRVFATIAPMTKEGQEAVNGFVSRASEYGAVILAQEWYYDALNVERQLARIREQVLLVDSLDVHNNMEFDSIKTNKVGILDGIFIPISRAKDIESLSSQVTFYNFEADKYGTFGWNNLKELNKNAENANGVTFITENSFNINNDDYLQFTAQFRKIYNKTASKLEVIGYDIFNLILKNCEIANKNKQNIAIALQNIDIYEGINGKIIFSNNKKANQSVKVFQYLRTKKNPIQVSNTQELASCIPPANDERDINLAESFFKLKQYNKALKIYNHYLKNNSSNINYLSKVSTIYKRIHNFDDLLTVALKWQQADTLSLQAKLDIACAYLYKNNFDMAEKYYLQLDSLSGGYDSSIKYNLGVVATKQQNNKKAVEYFLKTKEISPETTNIDYAIGKAYLDSGDKNEAITYFILAAQKENIDAKKYLKEKDIKW